MANAILKGSTVLDTSGFRKGFSDIKKSLASLKKEVAVPFAESGKAAADFAKKASLVAAALSGITVKNIFDGEKTDAQFRMLGMSLEEARKKTEDLRKMGMENDFTSWFDPGQWETASLALRRISATELDTPQFLRLVGDAAAHSQKPLDEMARVLGDFYTRLKAGKDISRAGMNLMQSGIISESDFNKINDLKNSGASVAQVWDVVTSSLGRCEGAMHLLAMTGSGQLGNLKTIIGESLEKVFQGLADGIRDSVWNINNSLIQLYNSGTIENWGKSIAAGVQSVTSWLHAAAKSYQNLNSDQQTQLKTLAANAGVGFLMWKSGFLEPMLRGLIGLVAFTATHLKAVGGTFAAFATAYAGFKLGNALWESLSPDGKGITERIANFLEFMMSSFLNACTYIGDLFAALGKKIKALLTGKDFDLGEAFQEAFKQANQVRGKEIQNRFRLQNEVSYDQTEKNPGKEWAERFRDALKNNLGTDAIKTDLKKALEALTPDSLKAFLSGIRDCKEEMQHIPEVTDQPIGNTISASLEEAKKKAEELKTSMMPVRGIFGNLNLPKIQNPADTVSGALTPKPSYRELESNTKTVADNSKNLRDLNTTIQEIQTNGLKICYA